jgi:hypothetical protein
MTEEKLYTLAEAGKVLAVRECDELGHTIITAMRIRGYDGLLKFEAWHCSRCKLEFVPKR